MGMHCVQPAMEFRVVLSFIGGPSSPGVVRLAPSVVAGFVLAVAVAVVAVVVVVVAVNVVDKAYRCAGSRALICLD